MPTPSLPRRLVFLGFFFVSGACGLVYEVVWIRMLGLTIGNTVYSLSTVLTAFMGGLALGSAIGGRLADRSRNPLLLYGVLEGGIAVACLAVPPLIAASEPFFAWLYRNHWTNFTTFSLARFVVCGLVLLVPTTLMGATLPVLSKYFVRRRETLGASLGLLYALNTLGAAAGAFCTGFWLIPVLGQTQSILLAAGGNLAVCVASVVLAMRREPLPAPAVRGEGHGAPVSPDGAADATAPESAADPSAGAADAEPLSTPVRRVALALGLSGVASMIYQVAWTRVLALNIGSSTYAFTMIVTAFILGLGLGSLLLAAWADRVRRLGGVFAATQVLIAGSALALVPVFGRLPGWLRGLFSAHREEFAESFARLHQYEFGVIFGLLLVPTLLMGATFPLAAKLVTRDLNAVGRSIGRIYAFNTVGAILGSFLGGFVFLPWVGLQGAIEVGAAVNLAAAATVLRGAGIPVFAAAGLVVGALPVFGLHLLPTWDAKALDSGVYLYVIRDVGDDGGEGEQEKPTGRGFYRPVFFKEGVSANVSVYRRDRRSIALRINGKTDASTTGDLPSQLLIGHLPMAVAPRIDRVLVIGLGSGLTLGAVGRHPAKEIEYVELCPEVDEAARRFFGEVTNGIFDDPRVRPILNDGRNHVALTDRTYDVISSQPTNLWIAGVGSLFTREYFVQCRDRLAPEGVLCQWVQAYKLSPEDFKSVVATFLEVFPGATLWEPKPGGDYALIGFKGPLRIDPARVAERFAHAGVAEDLQRACVMRWEDLLGYLIMGPEELRRMAVGAPLNTDDRAYLEFSTPRSVFRKARREQLEMIHAHRSDLLPLLLAEMPEGPERTRLEGSLARVLRAHAIAARGLEPWSEGNFLAAREKFEEALRVNPADPVAARWLTQIYSRIGQDLVGRGRPAEGLGWFERVRGWNPHSWEAENLIAFAHMATGNWGEARAHLERAHALAPDAYEVLVNRGVAAADGRDFSPRGAGADLPAATLQEALRHFEAAIEAQPDEDRAYIYAARIYRRLARFGEAERAYLAAIRLRPDTAALHHELAGVYASRQPPDPERAREHEEKARALERGGGR